jgi:hypothetical protein
MFVMGQVVHLAYQRHYQIWEGPGFGIFAKSFHQAAIFYWLTKWQSDKEIDLTPRFHFVG